MLQNDPDRLEIVARVPHEMEAGAIVSALEAAGVQAEAVGGYTAGFRAEAPGEVQVVVRHVDLERATSILAELRGDAEETSE